MDPSNFFYLKLQDNTILLEKVSSICQLTCYCHTSHVTYVCINHVTVQKSEKRTHHGHKPLSFILELHHRPVV